MYHIEKLKRVENTPEFETERLILRRFREGDEQALLDIFGDDDDSSVLWLGTEQGIVRYDRRTRKTGFSFGNIPVKYFFRNTDGNLWIGTDNGLFIKDEAGTVQYNKKDS